MTRAYFTIADKNHLHFYEQLKNSLSKFTDTPLILIDESKFSKYNDPHFFYRATPLIARELFKNYDELVKLDADQIILSDISDIWNIDADVGVVLNDPTYTINTWDIQPYYNNGLVVLKNKDFVEHWHRLCHSDHFLKYQFREQDLLNILCSDYHNYKVKCLDDEKIYGEWAKPLWPKAFIRDDKVYIPTPKGDKELAVIHFGGGNSPDKGNYRLRFQSDVIEFIGKAIK